MDSHKIRVLGRIKTLRLEPSFWEALLEYCWREQIGLEEACAFAQQRWGRQGKHLSFSVRMMLIAYFREAAQPAPNPKPVLKAC